MSYLPRMIYKAGKLSARPDDYCIVKNLDELTEKVDEGFLPLGCESIEAMGNIPELKLLMAQTARKAELEKRSAEIVEQVTKEIDKVVDMNVSENLPDAEEIIKPKKRRARKTNVN